MTPEKFLKNTPDNSPLRDRRDKETNSSNGSMISNGTLIKSREFQLIALNSTYKEFPEHDGLVNFDIDDRKFVAVANAHSDTHKPPIFQATDSKWWGWKDALSKVGITVCFLCPSYVKEKHAKKMGR